MALRLICASLATLALASVTSAATEPVRIPLCAGLTVVTAVSQTEGDYESIKTLQSVTPNEIRLRYSSEMMVQPFLSNDPPTLKQTNLTRSVQAEDLRSDSLHLQIYGEKLPAMGPATTAIGTSAAILKALHAGGSQELGIFIGFSGQEETIDRNVHPNVYDNQMIAPIHRVEPAPVMLDVLVNDHPVQLPAIHAA